MTEASEELPHLCGGCGKPLNDEGRQFCGVCEAKGCTYCGKRGHTRDEHRDNEGHIPSRDEEWSATMQNATRHILIRALGIEQDNGHRLCDLAAMLERQHSAFIKAGAKLDRDLERAIGLLKQSVETLEKSNDTTSTQARTIEAQQKTIQQYGGILAKAVERLGA